MLMENIESLENYEFPDYLPVTQILSKEYVQEFKNYKTSVQLKWKDVLGADEYEIYRKLQAS